MFAINGVTYPMIVKFQTLDDKARELPQASSKALASAFKDVAAHLVVRNFKFEMKDAITITSLAKALENQGLIFLQGNQERTKVQTQEGVIVTQGKKEVYHLYVAPKTGNFATFDFPVQAVPLGGGDALRFAHEVARLKVRARNITGDEIDGPFPVQPAPARGGPC